MQCTPPVAVAKEAGLLDLRLRSPKYATSARMRSRRAPAGPKAVKDAIKTPRQHSNCRHKVHPPSSEVSRRDTQRDCRRSRGGGTYLWLRSSVLGLGTSVPTPADGMRASNGATFGYRRISQSAQVEWCDEAVRASRDAACMHTGCDNEPVWPISGRDSGLRRVGGDDRAPTASHFC